MADKRSIKLLSFNPASKTFSPKRIAQELGQPSLFFPKFSDECLEPEMETDHGAQDADDIGISPNLTEEIFQVKIVVFDCIRKTVLKRTTKKIQFNGKDV